MERCLLEGLANNFIIYIKLIKMKSLFFVLLITAVFHSNKANAQNWPAAGSYTTNNTMGAYHGTWRWVSGTDTVTIYLETKKVYYDLNGGFYMDDLVGWHKYKKANKIIESSYPSIGNVQARTFLGSNQHELPNTVTGSLKDLKKNKYGDLKLVLNAAGTQLTWEMENGEGLRIAPFDAGFTLPKNMVLIKQ